MLHETHHNYIYTISHHQNGHLLFLVTLTPKRRRLNFQCYLQSKILSPKFQAPSCIVSKIITKYQNFFFRLAEKCGTLVGEIGEDEIYAEYRKKKSLTNFLCKVSSKDCVKSKKDEL